MATLSSILSVARDGVLAQTAALDVTGRNVAGANTPGYVRRTPVLESVPSGGVRLASAARSFDRFTYAQLVDQTGRLASARARSTALVDLEALVTPANDHLGDRADALFEAFHELAANPADPSVRSAVLARAEWLAAGFRETRAGVEGFRAELATRARDVATEVNARLENLSSVETSIKSALARGEDPSDLLDTRDRIVQEIGERVGARAVIDDDGTLTLFGGGTVLYEGGRAAKLVTSLDETGALRVHADRNGNTVDITSGITSGTLAGVRQARDVDAPTLLGEIDAFARSVIDAVNEVHEAGVGLDGSSGRPFFTPVSTTKGAAHAMAIDPSLADRPDLIAAAGSPGDLPGGNDVAVRLARLGSSGLAGGATAAERYAGLASTMGVLVTSATSEERMRQDTVATASALRESTSGVSTDEEMIHLQQFQRAFEASTRVLRVVDELFDALMSIVR